VDWLYERYEKEMEKLEGMSANYCREIEEVLNSGDVQLPSAIIRAKINAIKEYFEPLKDQLLLSLQEAITKAAANPPNPRSGKRSFGEKPSNILWGWFYKNLENPYPTEEEKKRLAFMCDLTMKQINTWFANHRERFKQKILDKMKEQEDMDSSDKEVVESEPLFIDRFVAQHHVPGQEGPEKVVQADPENKPS